jgi:hypothetical protein
MTGTIATLIDGFIIFGAKGAVIVGKSFRKQGGLMKMKQRKGFELSKGLLALIDQMSCGYGSVRVICVGIVIKGKLGVFDLLHMIDKDIVGIEILKLYNRCDCDYSKMLKIIRRDMNKQVEAMTNHSD